MIKSKIQRIKEIFKDEGGDGYVLTCVIALTVMMFFLVGIEVIRVNTIGNGIRDALENSVKRTVTTNWDDVFGGVREGYSGAYTYNDSSFDEIVDRNDVMEELQDLLLLSKEGNAYGKVKSDKTEFEIRNLDLKVKNSEFITNNKFYVYATIDVTIPMGMLGFSYPVEFPLKIKTAFSPMF